MSASSERGPGRPPGITEATLQKQRRVRAMRAKGVAVETIAAVEECEPAYVRMLLNGAEKKEDASDPAAERDPPRPRRLSRRAAQYRAWEIVQQRPTPTLGLDVNAFWIRLIVEIHETGDGVRLGIGETTSRFAARSDLELLFSRADHLVIDDWLKRLFERGRLLDIGGVDIGIPPGMKLTPAENIRGKKRAAQLPQDGQTVMLQAVPGGLSGATEIHLQTQIKPQLNLRPGATEILQNANLIPNSIAPLAYGHAAAATAYAKDFQSLSSSSSIGSPAETDARDGNIICVEVGVSVAPDANLIPPPDANDIPSGEVSGRRLSPADLTAELAALAGLGRAPNAEDLGWVEAWADQGFSPETMRGVIEIKRAQMNGKQVTGLRYFHGAMQDTRKSRGRPAAALAPKAVAPVLSAEDQAIRDLLRPSQDAWRKDRGCPFAPTLEAFTAACLNEKGKALAHRWLDLWTVWDDRRRPRDLKPPDFTLMVQDPERFETALLEIEEEVLTAPDPPEAAD